MFEQEKNHFLKEFNEIGYVFRDSGFSKETIAELRKAVMECVQLEAEGKQSDVYKEYGLLLCSAYYGDKYPVFFEVFENETLFNPIDWILDKWNITYLYSCASIAPKSKIITSSIHSDMIRYIPDCNVGVGVVICLDDYTEDNGATWILPKSHLNPQKPDEEYFYKNAIRFIAKAGTVCYFHQNLWHAAGQNNSDAWRSSLLLGMCRPWLKQRIDIPKFLSHIDTSKLSDNTLQKLGFFSVPPGNFEEYFVKEKRTYTQPFV